MCPSGSVALFRRPVFLLHFYTDTVDLIGCVWFSLWAEGQENQQQRFKGQQIAEDQVPKRLPLVSDRRLCDHYQTCSFAKVSNEKRSPCLHQSALATVRDTKQV